MKHLTQMTKATAMEAGLPAHAQDLLLKEARVGAIAGTVGLLADIVALIADILNLRQE